MRRRIAQLEIQNTDSHTTVKGLIDQVRYHNYGLEDMIRRIEHFENDHRKAEMTITDTRNKRHESRELVDTLKMRMKDYVVPS